MKRIPDIDRSNIVKLYVDGSSVMHIASLYNLSHEGVRNILRQNNIVLNRTTKITLDNEQEIIKMYTDGEKNEVIGKKFLIDRHTVTAIIKRNNIKPKDNSVISNPSIQEKVKSLFLDGVKCGLIAEKLNISLQSVTRVLHKFKLRAIEPKNIYNFTQNELEFIDKFYPLFGSTYCAKQLNIPIKIIKNKTNRMPMKRIYITDNGLKPCQKCYQLKPIDDFYKLERLKRSGRFTYCKICTYNDTKNRMKTNINCKLRCLLASRILAAIISQNGCKSARTLELLGGSVNTARLHLESQFTTNMTWENRGKYGWNIDHIIPVNEFDLTVPEQQKKCFHYTNLRPLWATTKIAIKMGDIGMVGNINRNAHQYKENPHDVQIKEPTSSLDCLL